MRNFPARFRLSGLILVAALSLMGCKEVLYSGLDENQANEMVSALAASGVSASRERDKKGIYSVLVDETMVATSITLLKNQGLPRERFQSLGDVFSAEGIVGTPFEQQARFIHAMNQELSHTVTSIDGVRSARVLVTSPPRGRYEQTAPAASASVVIHYEADFDERKYVSTIKTVVAHSLPNLGYEDVAVAMFPAGGPAVEVMSTPVVEETPTGFLQQVQSVISEWRPQSETGNRLLIALGLIGTAVLILLLRGALFGTGRARS